MKPWAYWRVYSLMVRVFHWLKFLNLVVSSVIPQNTSSHVILRSLQLLIRRTLHTCSGNIDLRKTVSQRRRIFLLLTRGERMGEGETTQFDLGFRYTNEITIRSNKENKRHNRWGGWTGLSSDPTSPVSPQMPYGETFYPIHGLSYTPSYILLVFDNSCSALKPTYLLPEQ